MSAPGSDCSGLAPVLRQALETGEDAIESLQNALPGPRTEQSSSINMNELVQDVLSLSTDKLLASGAVVDWRAAPVLPALQGRPNSLRALLKYLLDNAIEAVHEASRDYREIRIDTSAENGDVVIAIMDNGPGIPDSIAFKVFEPFFCGWERPREHAGMGLTLAQEISISHGGDIEVDRNFVGGCRVFVRLPHDGYEQGEA